MYNILSSRSVAILKLWFRVKTTLGRVKINLVLSFSLEKRFWSCINTLPTVVHSGTFMKMFELGFCPCCKILTRHGVYFERHVTQLPKIKTSWKLKLFHNIWSRNKIYGSFDTKVNRTKIQNGVAISKKVYRNSACYRTDKLKTQILKPTVSCFTLFTTAWPLDQLDMK